MAPLEHHLVREMPRYCTWETVRVSLVYLARAGKEKKRKERTNEDRAERRVHVQLLAKVTKSLPILGPAEPR
jgi:hypothetical protein